MLGVITITISQTVKDTQGTRVSQQPRIPYDLTSHVSAPQVLLDVSLL